VGDWGGTPAALEGLMGMVSEVSIIYAHWKERMLEQWLAAQHDHTGSPRADSMSLHTGPGCPASGEEGAAARRRCDRLTVATPFS
jgi:hypothetical protein